MRKFYSLITMLLIVTIASSQTYTWNNAAGGAWGTPTNWTPNRTVVTANDILVFSAGASYTVTGVPTGTFNIKVKSSHTLARVLTNQVLVLPNNAINFGTLLEGDVNNDNFVTLSDLSLLINSFNKTVGDPGYDTRADLNNDGFVTLADLSLLINNFNQAGEDNP